jgi:hypothetical protein
VRESEGDDLASVERIGEDLLVSGHRGIETHLTQRLTERAEALSLKHRAVLQDQHGFSSCLRTGHDWRCFPIELHD